jgi:hypothetical protein
MPACREDEIVSTDKWLSKVAAERFAGSFFAATDDVDWLRNKRLRTLP